MIRNRLMYYLKIKIEKEVLIWMNNRVGESL
jgi:hypothetical protein